MDDGISAQCLEEEKLLYVWRLYQHTEVNGWGGGHWEEKLLYVWRLCYEHTEVNS